MWGLVHLGGSLAGFRPLQHNSSNFMIVLIGFGEMEWSIDGRHERVVRV